MYILGMCFPVYPSLWCVFVGICIGASIFYSKGLRNGFERAKKQMEREHANQAYMAYIQNMMRGQQ